MSCDHLRAGKAPMDIMTWFCPDCDATIDFSDPDCLRIDRWKDGREERIPYDTAQPGTPRDNVICLTDFINGGNPSAKGSDDVDR